MVTIIAKNTTADDIPIDNLSVVDAVLPAFGSVTLTDTNSVYLIQADPQLRDYVAFGYATPGDVVISDGTSDLSTTDGLNYLSTVALSRTSANVDTFITQHSPAQVITVAVSGGQFTSVAAAIASITDATVTKPYMVSVCPGEYTEPPFTMKPYVSIVGVDGFYSVHIKTNNNSAHFITGDAGSELLNVSLTGPTGVGYATIDYQTASLIPFMLDHVLIRGGYYGVWCHPAASRGVVHAFFVTDWYSGNTINQLFRSTDYGNITCMNSAKMSGPAGSCVTGWAASGPNAEFTLDLCAFRDATGTAFFGDDGAYFRLTSCTVSKASKGIHVGSTGTGTAFDGVGCVIHEADVTTHIQTDTPSCIVQYAGTAWSSRMSLTAGTAAFMDVVDSDAQAVVVIGELQVGGDTATAVPVGSYIRKTASTAVFEASSVSRNSGLDIDVAAGSGFVSDGSSVVAVTWSATTLTLTASKSQWVLVNSAGVVQKTDVEPDYAANLVLAVTVTDATDVIFLTSHYVSSSQSLSAMHEYFEGVVGPISVSGCVATKNTTPSLQLDVDGGSYYIADNRFTAVAHTAISFTYWYRDGSGGWNWITSQTAINVTQYDDGSGTLASLTGTNFRRDAVYLVVNGSGTEYHVVLGQEQFATAVVAITNPTPPESLRVSALRVAAVVVQRSATDITTVYNQLPVLGQLATNTTGVTVHGALSGLSADDHPQYQLVTGKNAASGYAGLNGSSQVATAQLPFTATPPVNVTKAAAAVGTSTEIARQDHKHDVTTAAAVAVGTANAEGSATSLARSDHTHQVTGFSIANLSIDAGGYPNVGDASTTTPASPATGATLFSRFRAGRHMAAQVGSSGVPYSFQPALFASKITLWTAQGNGTAVSTINFGTSNTGTAGTLNVATTNFSTSLRRLRIATTATTAGSSCGTRHNLLQFYRGDAAGRGGFFYVARFVIDTVVAGMRWFVGLYGSAAVIGNVNPSSLANTLGFGIDAGQTTVRWISNNTSGTATVVDMGVSFPATTATVVYEIRIFCAPNGSTVYYSIERLDSAALAEGSVSAVGDIPLSTQLLSPQIWMNNGAATGTVAVAVVSQYLETDN